MYYGERIDHVRAPSHAHARSDGRYMFGVVWVVCVCGGGVRVCVGFVYM